MSDVHSCSIQTRQDRFGNAWAEIYFDGAGWVPFEPTPERGPGQDGVSS